jgi:ribosomal protein L35AE/L33A
MDTGKRINRMTTLQNTKEVRKMKKVLTPATITTLVLILSSSAILAMLVTVLAFSFSNSAMLTKENVTNPSQVTEIIGKVVSVKPSHLKIFSGSLTVKDEEGKKQVIKASSKILDGIRVGDSVDVKVENGKAKSIIRLWGSG